MLALQASMNARVDPNWVVAKYPYLRAVVIEAAEAIEHHGWKWWKHQDKDLPQLQMELIDVWHFILSELLLENQGEQAESLRQLRALLDEAQHKASINFDNQTYRLTELDLLGKLELLIALSVSRRIELSLFAAIMADCEMDWTELYCQYVGKNVLNFFRQDNGYKQGTYKKLWQGREDNEHLVEIMAKLDPADAAFKENIYSALSESYPA